MMAIPTLGKAIATKQCATTCSTRHETLQAVVRVRLFTDCKRLFALFDFSFNQINQWLCTKAQERFAIHKKRGRLAHGSSLPCFEHLRVTVPLPLS